MSENTAQKKEKKEIDYNDPISVNNASKKLSNRLTKLVAQKKTCENKIKLLEKQISEVIEAQRNLYSKINI